MSQLNFHPAIGFGDMMGGWWAVPQNPIRDAGTSMVPSVQAQYPNQPVMVRRIGDIVGASFTVPQNPLRDAILKGMTGCGCAGGGGCGCASCSGNGGMSGLGDFISDPVVAWMQQPSPISAVSNLTFWGGLVLALGAYLEFGAGGRHAGRSRKNPRHRRRRNESVEMGYYRGGRFHPIRASDDYDPEAVGERYQYATRKKSRRR